MRHTFSKLAERIGRRIGLLRLGPARVRVLCQRLADFAGRLLQAAWCALVGCVDARRDGRVPAARRRLTALTRKDGVLHVFDMFGHDGLFDVDWKGYL